MLTHDQVIGQVARGQLQKVVMPTGYSNGGDAIVADASIARIADFKGKKTGYNPLSPSDFLLSYAMKTAGLGLIADVLVFDDNAIESSLKEI